MKISELIQKLQSLANSKTISNGQDLEVLVCQESDVALPCGEPTPHLFYERAESQEVMKVTLFGVWPPTTDRVGWKCPTCGSHYSPDVMGCDQCSKMRL